MARRPEPARAALAAVIVVIMGVLAVGCGSADDVDGASPPTTAISPTTEPGAAARSDVVELSEWVAQFDEACIGVGDTLQAVGAAMSDDEHAAFTAGAVAVLRALRPPDEMADTAAELLDLLEAGQQPGVDGAAMVDIERRMLDAMQRLGVSDECIGDAPAE